MKITSPLTKTVGANTYVYTYDPHRPHAVKSISYTGTNPLDMGPRAITYNAEQMPIRIEQVKAGNTTIVDYLYDGTSKRVKKAVQGGATTFYVGEHCEVINGVETNYIFAGNLRIAKKTQQSRYYFHKDHLGSSTAMTDASGAKVETTEYVPYGEMREHTGAEVTNYKFTDQELDPETGLYNYGARLYDPVIGRFITPDTMIPDVYDPQMLNRYSYCKSNPLIYVDPNGHMYTDAKADGGWEGADYGGDPDSSDNSAANSEGSSFKDAIKGFIDGILGGMPNPSKQECPDDYTHRHPEKSYGPVQAAMDAEKNKNKEPKTPELHNPYTEDGWYSRFGNIYGRPGIPHPESEREIRNEKVALISGAIIGTVLDGFRGFAISIIGFIGYKEAQGLVDQYHDYKEVTKDYYSPGCEPDPDKEK